MSKFGWRRDALDPRDFKYVAPQHMLTALPPKVDLRPMLPEVYDQGSLGACTSHSAAAMLYYLQAKQQKPNPYTPSRLAIYYNTRLLDNCTEFDSGASLRDTIKSIARWGFCNEELWPYHIEKFKRKPTKKVYSESVKNKILQYEKLSPDLNTLKTCLAEGNMFVFGFSVTESFDEGDVKKTGVMTLPAPSEKILGGHAVACTGFNDETERFDIRNSWAKTWGNEGYFTMPYSFITNNLYTDDFWTIKLLH